MTKNELEAMILANISQQFDQLVLKYGAVAATPVNVPVFDAAVAQLQKLADLLVILEEGLKNLRLQETRTIEYGADG